MRILIRCLLATLSLLGWALSGLAAPIVPHVVTSAVDLYPYGNGGSHNITFWKNMVYVSADGFNCGSAATLFSVNVSNPSNIFYVAKGGLGGCKANELKVVEDRLYVASWSSHLRVFDISSPGIFNLQWTYAGSNAASWHVDVYRQRAYVTAADATYPNDYGIRILDVSPPNPPNPNARLIDILSTDDRNIGGIAVRGSYAYYADWGNFEIANISDEQNPYILTTRNLGQPVQGVRLRDQYAYVYCPDSAGGLYVLDITDPTNPVQVGHYIGGSGDAFLMGDYAFMAGYGDRLRTVDISNPANPHAVADTNVDFYSDSVSTWEASVTGNGRHIYIGSQEMNYYPPGHPDAGNNYYLGRVYALQVFDQDPDNAGPGAWSQLTPSEASWDTQYDADTLPTAATPAWPVFEGAESWASATGGTLHISDTGTGGNDRIRWWRNWDATGSRGATVLVRARCPSYNLGAAPLSSMSNLRIEDGKYIQDFAILSDRVRAVQANREYPLDGTAWRTYRITTQDGTFSLYVDEQNVPLLTGVMPATTNRARVIFGAGSGLAQQVIDFDFVHCSSSEPRGPSQLITTQTPTISINVADTAGKGSLSGINPLSARVYWSTDGGAAWSTSGGPQWEVMYEGDALPAAANPPWSVPEGSESWASVSAGTLRVNDTSTASNTKIKWARAWGESPATGATVLALARCASAGGDTTFGGNLFIENGSRQERFKILPDRVEAAETGLSYPLDGTAWHLYRITTRNNDFKLYVDEAAIPVLAAAMATTTSQNRVMFGSGASAATQDIYFDYVRYSIQGELPPGQGNGGGPVNVGCTGTFGTDRGVITAQSVPFNQYSQTLNKVRFSLRDMAGNTGYSPIYTIRSMQPGLALMDFDHDGDVDLIDFGHMQACFTTIPTPPSIDCRDADLNSDSSVDGTDFNAFVPCLAGADLPPGC